MSADNRQVATDALETLGMRLDATAARDAIHLAVEPVVSNGWLQAGNHVGFLPNGRVGHCDNPVGIVDPFLTGPVQAGDRFWLVVYPRQITSLRHVWSHPAFEDAPFTPSLPVPPVSTDPKQVAEAWLRDYATTFPVKYEDLMARAGDYLETGDYWYGGSVFDGWTLSDEFWDRFEIVTGKSVPKSDRGSFFSCSC